MMAIWHHTYKILGIGVACSLLGIFPLVLEGLLSPDAFETTLTSAWRTLLILSTVFSALAIICYVRALYLLHAKVGDAA